MNRLNQIRQLPCVKCHTPPPSQACHANWGEYGKGRGIKADDEYTISLCGSCHSWLDEYKELNREQAKAWFIKKLDFINKVLSEMNDESIF